MEKIENQLEKYFPLAHFTSVLRIRLFFYED